MTAEDMENKTYADRFDTIVIGAGISGLCAAKKLESYDQKVLVLEARERVGGRTFTIKDDTNGATDVGGAYVGPGQNRVYRVIKELGLSVYNVHDEDANVLDLGDIWSTFFGNIPPFWNPFKILDVNNVVRTLDNMAKEVPVDAPWKAKKAEEWDAMTVSEFVDEIVWTRDAKELMKVFLRSVLCVEMCEVSLLAFLWYINSGGGIARMSSITNGAQEKKVDGGTQQISELIAAKLNTKVKLSSPVISIEQTDDHTIVTDLHGNKYRANHVISAIPVSLLNRITFDPPLPGERYQMMQRIPMGCIIKTIMCYETPFWRDMGLNGSVTSSKGVCNYCIDDTKPDGSHPAIMGFILADRAREMALTTADARKKALCEFYTRVFNSDKFMQPTDYIEYNWMEDQYSGGCYTGVMPPKFLTIYGRYLREPFGRIYFAGTQTATVWSGYIDGAIQAGERAACEISVKLAQFVHLISSFNLINFDRNPTNSLVLHEAGKIEEHEIWSKEPESLDYPATPIDVTLLEAYLPSNTTLFRCFVAGTAAFISYSVYFFFCGWHGALFWRWVVWRYDLDDYTVENLAKNVRFPTLWK